MKKITIFLLLIPILLLALFYLPETHLKNGETETNLPVIPKNAGYDFILLGSSHARIFSRFDSHTKIERTLNKTLINLSQGGNRESIKNQRTYLKYFYQRGNTNQRTIYVLDPFVFYRKKLLNNPRIFDYEPFRLDFLYTLLTSGDYDWATISSYISAFNHGKNLSSTQIKQGTVSAQLITTRMKTLYRDPIDVKEMSYLKEIVELSQIHGAKVIVIIPPTLLPLDKHCEVVKQELIKLKKATHLTLYDFSKVITDPKYFYDTDHLNEAGIAFFVDRYLKPTLN